MNIIPELVFLLLCGRLAISDRGDCGNLQNLSERNVLFENSLEVDPCGITKASKCVSKDNCTLASLDPENSPFKIVVAQKVSTDTIVIKVDLLVNIQMEYFVEAHPVKEDGELDPMTPILGRFEDPLFPDCNSFACCDSTDKNLHNVARKCPDAARPDNNIGRPESLLKTNPNLLAISYLWYPPKEFSGFVIFSGYFFTSSSEHWEKVTSDVLELVNPASEEEDDDVKNTTTTTKAPSQSPKPTTVNSLPTPPTLPSSTPLPTPLPMKMIENTVPPLPMANSVALPLTPPVPESKEATTAAQPNEVNDEEEETITTTTARTNKKSSGSKKKKQRTTTTRSKVRSKGKPKKRLNKQLSDTSAGDGPTRKPPFIYNLKHPNRVGGLLRVAGLKLL